MHYARGAGESDAGTVRPRGARPRPQCELRATECLLAAACARPRLEGEGGDPREPGEAAALVVHRILTPPRHPPRDLRPRASGRDASHLTPRALRSRRLAMRLLRKRGEQADARPRRPALTGWGVGVGERRHLVRSVQPPQGRPPARGDRYDAADDASSAHAGPLHPPGCRARARLLANVPPHARAGGNRSRGVGP